MNNIQLQFNTLPRLAFGGLLSLAGGGQEAKVDKDGPSQSFQAISVTSEWWPASSGGFGVEHSVWMIPVNRCHQRVVT